MTKVGEHITLDIIGTTQEYKPAFFEKIVYKIAKKAKVTVLEISKHKFEPQGFTLVALLAESHMSFHTYPEKGIISFDFYTCGAVSPSIALDVIKKEILPAAKAMPKQVNVRQLIAMIITILGPYRSAMRLVINTSVT